MVLVKILNLHGNSFPRNLGDLKDEEYFALTGLICPAFMNNINSQSEPYGRRKIKKLQQENELRVRFAWLGGFLGAFQAINPFVASHKSRSRLF